MNLDLKKKWKKDHLEEIKHNNLVNKKHKKMHTAFNYAVNLLILPSAVGDCVSISAFALLLGIHLGLTSSAVWLKICAMTARIKKYKSIIKKKNNQHFKVVLLAKTELSAINILISNALIDSYINYKEFVSTNNVLKEYKTKKNQKS